MSTSPAHVLESFIHDDRVAMQHGDWGSYYPDNHHRISPLLPKAAKLLTKDQHIELYFHLLRRGECLSIKRPDEFVPLRAAYARILQLDRQDPVCHLPNPKGLFLFGHGRNGPLVGEGTQEDLVAYAKHLTTWRYLTSFSSFPGMLSKQDKFKALASDQALVHRATEVVLLTDLAKDLATPTSLWFWALVLLALQDRASGNRIANWMPQAAARGASYRHLLEILVRFLQAADRDDLLPEINERLDI